MTVKSLVTKRLYVALQGRIRLRNGQTFLHIQGKGPQVNRAYGVAENVNLGSSLGEYLSEAPKYQLDSLADTGQIYFHLQAVVNGDLVHFQVGASPACNRPYGVAFDVPVEKLPNIAEFIQQELGTPEVSKEYSVEVSCK